jgi:Fe-S-cluster containining protein
MVRLQLDPALRFSCQQSGRCCRQPWEVAVSRSEVEGYRRDEAGRWFRERLAAAEGTAADPFERLPGLASRFYRIRKRDDGACGFLSPQGRCRLHEELGARRKPLTCRTFPWRLHPTPHGVVVTASFSCPTVVAQQGLTAGEQRSELRTLQVEWAASRGEPERPVRLSKRRLLPGPALATLRDVLGELLDRRGPGGAPDLRRNVGRIARTLEDLSRYRVQRLSDERLSEYLELTGRFAAKSDKPLPPRPPSRVARLLFRGLVFAVGAVRERLRTGGGDSPLRLRLVRMLAHVHGLGPPVAGLDIVAARRTPVRLESEGLRRVAHGYLRAHVASVGTGRSPVVEELGMAVGLLNAACAFAAMRASAEGSDVTEQHLAEALMEASDCNAEGGRLGRLVGFLAGGVESLYLFESGFAPAGGGTA